MTVGVIPAYAYIYHMWDTLATGYLGAPDLVTAPQGGVIASAHDVALYLGVLMNGEHDSEQEASPMGMHRHGPAMMTR